MFIPLDSNQKLYEMIERAIQKGFLYHIFFWFVFFFFLIIVDSSNAGLGTKMIHKSIRILFYAGIVYTNLNYLFPRYLKKNRLVLYVILLFLLVVLVTPVEVILHFVLFSAKGAPFEEVFTLKNNSIFFLGSFFIAFSSSIYKIMNDWMNQQRERLDLQRQTLKSELKYLKTQINPHFFFNTLNSLYALTLKKSDKAPEIVLKLSDMMRYMLYESNERTIDLGQELNYVRNYLELEKVRHGENFKINLNIAGDPSGHEIAPLLFIPFLENSFKHGLDHELKSGFVNIDIEVQEDSLTLDVENSKPKTIELKLRTKKVGGIGLSNVKRRLNILYAGRYKLNIEDKEERFSIHLELRGTKSKKI